MDHLGDTSIKDGNSHLQIDLAQDNTTSSQQQLEATKAFLYKYLSDVRQRIKPHQLEHIESLSSLEVTIEKTGKCMSFIDVLRDPYVQGEVNSRSAFITTAVNPILLGFLKEEKARILEKMADVKGFSDTLTTYLKALILSLIMPVWSLGVWIDGIIKVGDIIIDLGQWTIVIADIEGEGIITIDELSTYINIYTSVLKDHMTKIQFTVIKSIKNKKPVINEWFVHLEWYKLRKDKLYSTKKMDEIFQIFIDSEDLLEDMIKNLILVLNDTKGDMKWDESLGHYSDLARVINIYDQKYVEPLFEKCFVETARWIITAPEPIKPSIKKHRNNINQVANPWDGWHTESPPSPITTVNPGWIAPERQAPTNPKLQEAVDRINRIRPNSKAANYLVKSHGIRMIGEIEFKLLLWGYEGINQDELAIHITTLKDLWIIYNVPNDIEEVVNWVEKTIPQKQKGNSLISQLSKTIYRIGVGKETAKPRKRFENFFVYVNYDQDELDANIGSLETAGFLLLNKTDTNIGWGGEWDKHVYNMSEELKLAMLSSMNNLGDVDAEILINRTTSLWFNFENQARFRDMFMVMENKDKWKLFLKKILRHFIRPDQVRPRSIQIRNGGKANVIDLNDWNRLVIEGVDKRTITLLADHEIYLRYIQ